MNNKVDETSVARAVTPQSAIVNPPSATSAFSLQPSALPLLTRRELASVLKISIRTLDRMVAAGEIPVVRLRNRPRFHLPDVLAQITS